MISAISLLPLSKTMSTTDVTTVSTAGISVMSLFWSLLGGNVGLGGDMGISGRNAPWRDWVDMRSDASRGPIVDDGLVLMLRSSTTALAMTIGFGLWILRPS